MDSAVTFLFLLGCCLVWSGSPFEHSPASVMIFSTGTQLLVKTEDHTTNYDQDDQGQNHTDASAGPTVQILSSLPLHQDPSAPHLLVCLLTGFNSPVQNILWWVNDRMETGATVSLVTSEEGSTYSASSVWEVSTADWWSRSTYWCGTVQAGQVYRQRLCPQNQL